MQDENEILKETLKKIQMYMAVVHNSSDSDLKLTRELI